MPNQTGAGAEKFQGKTSQGGEGESTKNLTR